MKSIYREDPLPPIPRLALKPKEAAESLGLSEKGLWNITAPRGDLPCVRLGSRVLYAPHQIRHWLNRKAVRQQAEAQGAAGEGQCRR